MEPNEILSRWHQLLADTNAQSKAGEMPSVETNTIVSGGKARLAICDNEFCTLLLPIAIKDTIEPDQITQAISVRPVALGHKGKNVRFLEVRCGEKGLNEVFARVVSDILRRIESGVTGPKAVDEALIEFRKLLNKRHKRAPNEMTVVGLIGELLTLIEVLKVDARALSAWHGPDSDRHDFRAGSVTIEVKTSLGADGNRIHINGIRQLESAPDDSLLIRHVRIEPDPDGGLSVPELVSEAAAQLTDRVDFDVKLDKLGYSADCAESWDTKKYRYVRANTYEVREGFPRLVTDFLNVEWPLAGVSAVSYELDLGAAADFKIEKENWQMKIKEFCECL